MPWCVRHPNGQIVHSRYNGRIDTIDEKYIKYAHRYSRQLARKVAREIGGEVVRINPDGTLSTEK